MVEVRFTLDIDDASEELLVLTVDVSVVILVASDEDVVVKVESIFVIVEAKEALFV